MAYDALNLKPLLLGDVPSAAISSCVDAASAAAKRSLDGTPSLDWMSLASDIGDKVGEMFDIPLIGLLTGAWKDFRELADAADPDRHTANETVVVALFDHEFEASFTPHIDIEVSGMKAVRVDFEIAAGIELEGIELEIRGGVIRAVRLGSIFATVSLKCQGLTLFEQSSQKLQLPGEIRLSPGVPLRSPAHA
jgi:hypothetical protein